MVSDNAMLEKVQTKICNRIKMINAKIEAEVGNTMI